MKLVNVFTTFSLGEAEAIRSRLDAAGFHTVVQHELSALNSMAEGGVRVQVPDDEADAAKELLASADTAASEEDPSAG